MTSWIPNISLVSNVSNQHLNSSWFLIGRLETSVYPVTNRLLYPGTMWTFQESPPWISFEVWYRELRIEVDCWIRFFYQPLESIRIYGCPPQCHPFQGLIWRGYPQIAINQVNLSKVGILYLWKSWVGCKTQNPSQFPCTIHRITINHPTTLAPETPPCEVSPFRDCGIARFGRWFV